MRRLLTPSPTPQTKRELYLSTGRMTSIWGIFQSCTPQVSLKVLISQKSVSASVSGLGVGVGVRTTEPVTDRLSAHSPILSKGGLVTLHLADDDSDGYVTACHLYKIRLGGDNGYIVRKAKDSQGE